jgi:hypothetical protein
VPEYREAVAEGLAELDRENYLEARRQFARAHELFPNARTFRALSVVSFELRRYADCVAFCEQALASAVRPLDDKQRVETLQLRARARHLTAELTLRVQPNNARVSIDAAEPVALPSKPILLDVGSHQLEFQADGYESQRRALHVEGGEAKTWQFALAPSAIGVAPLASHAKPSRPEDANVWGVTAAGIAVGMGVASTAAAGVFTVIRHRKGQTLRATMSGEPTYPLHLEQWQDSRAKPYAFAAVGSAALAGGVVSLLARAGREPFPRWASVLVAAAGLGLASWGIVQVHRGESCGGDPAGQRLCSEGLERRDRGALLLLSTLPFLAVPVTQLVLRRTGARRAQNNRSAVNVGFDARQRSVSCEARVIW